MQRTSGWTGRGPFYSLILRQTFDLQWIVIAVGLALPVLAVIPLTLQERLIDQAIPASDISLILLIAAQYAGVVAASGALKLAVTYLRGWIQEIVSRVLRVAIVEAQRRREPDSAGRHLGSVTSVITGEVEDLGAFASEAVNTPLIEGGTLLTLIGFLTYSEPLLAAIGILALIVQAILTPLIQNRINVLTRKRITTLRRAGLDMIDAVAPHHTNLIVLALHEIRRTYRLRLRMNILKAVLKFLNNLVMHAATIAVFCVGGLLVIRGEIGVGVIVAFLTGFRQINDQWGELLDFYRRFTDARIKYRLVTSALAPDATL